MHRSLVLFDEAARHPFLRSLPPHVRQVAAEEETESVWRLTASDVRGAATTYFAVFAAVLIFIA